MPKLLAPIYPNAGVEAWYTRELQLLVREMARQMLNDVIAAWQHDDPDIGMAQDAEEWILTRALRLWAERWTKRMEDKAREISIAFASRVWTATQNSMQSALRDAGFTVRFTPTRRSVRAYQAVVDTQVGLIKSIPQQYLVDVQGVVYKSVMEGGNLERVVKDVQQKYGIAHRRAAFIARDQNNKAKAVIERERRRELGITRAKWRHSGAGKEPRPEHVAFDGKYYEIEKGAYLEGKWTWPGMEPNCRCTDMAVIDD
jgi:SPP1 gp7 family putative phage head morphogenesis protein